METHGFPTLPSKYDLFGNKFKPNDVAKNGHTEKFFPINSIDDKNTGPITFLIRGTQDQVDFTKSYLLIKGRFIGQSKAGDAATDNTIKKVSDRTVDFGPVNLLPHSIFKSVDVSVNGTSVSLGDQNYAYRAYFQTLLNNNKENLEKNYVLAGWVKDDFEHMDSAKIAENTALKTRRDRSNDDQDIWYVIRLTSSIFQLNENLLSNLDVQVTLHKNPEPQFYLMHSTGGVYDFKISKAVMCVRKTTTSPEYNEAIEKILGEGTSVKYILDDPRVVAHQIPSGVPCFNKDHITFGHLPRQVMVAMVETTAFNGTCTKNPFNFQHFKAKRISLSRDGIEYPSPAIITDFTKKDYSEAYFHLMSSLNAENSPFVPDISEKEFGKGFTIFSWDMSPDQYGSDNIQLSSGSNTNIHLSLEFAENLTNPITLLIYYQLDMQMSVTRHRQVTVESH
jgi:hypothetical protein